MVADGVVVGAGDLPLFVALQVRGCPARPGTGHATALTPADLAASTLSSAGHPQVSWLSSYQETVTLR